MRAARVGVAQTLLSLTSPAYNIGIWRTGCEAREPRRLLLNGL